MRIRGDDQSKTTHPRVLRVCCTVTCMRFQSAEEWKRNLSARERNESGALIKARGEKLLAKVLPSEKNFSTSDLLKISWNDRKS